MVLIGLLCKDIVLLTAGFSGLAMADCLEVKEPKHCIWGGNDGLSTCWVGFIFIGESG